MLLTKNKLLRRISFTILIIFIFLLGRHIPLPEATMTSATKEVHPFQLVDFQSTQSSLFLFGIGPWITTTIFWSIFSTLNSEMSRTLEKRKQDIVQYLLLLVISSIQIFFFIRDIHHMKENLSILLALALFSSLLAGVFILVWISSLNAQYGIGGSSIIILVSVIGGFIRTGIGFFNSWSQNQVTIIWFLSGWLYLLAVLYLVSFFEKAEFQIPLNRASISSQYHQDAVFPIKFTPANNLPIMYAANIIQFLLLLFSQGERLLHVHSGIDVRTLLDTESIPGLVLYLSTIYFLTIFLAPLYLDAKTISKQMQQTGEYFDYINPGKMTLAFLKRCLTIQTHIAALYSITFVGLPYIVNLFFPLPPFFLSVPTISLILVGLLSETRNQVEMLRIESFYKTYHKS